MRLLLTLVLLSLSSVGVPDARAQESAVVVELYTSQGCSACPPADAFFAELARMDGVIALSLHVDYWDYIGWKDQFAQPGFTARQQAYAVAAGERTIYTPQIVVAGMHRIVGVDTVGVLATVGAHLGQPAEVALVLSRAGDRLLIEAAAQHSRPMQVHLVRYLPEATVAIETGENAGHTIRYVNIVTSWDVIGEWTGAAPLQLDAVLPGDDPAVVIVQEDGPGAILAAARVD